eukprot:gene12717-biopygen9339
MELASGAYDRRIVALFFTASNLSAVTYAAWLRRPVVGPAEMPTSHALPVLHFRMAAPGTTPALRPLAVKIVRLREDCRSTDMALHEARIIRLLLEGGRWSPYIAPMYYPVYSLDRGKVFLVLPMELSTMNLRQYAEMYEWSLPDGALLDRCPAAAGPTRPPRERRRAPGREPQ